MHRIAIRSILSSVVLAVYAADSLAEEPREEADRAGPYLAAGLIASGSTTLEVPAGLGLTAEQDADAGVDVSAGYRFSRRLVAGYSSAARYSFDFSAHVPPRLLATRSCSTAFSR